MKPTLVILAAGMGSRYGSLKQIDGIGPNGETIIEYSVFDALRNGFGKIVFIIRKNIEKEFDEVFSKRFKGKVPYELVYQELDMLPEGFNCPEDREKPWGTGHAVWVARNAVKEPFAVINADDFYGNDAFKVLAEELSKPDIKKSDAFMVGYRLGNTLSEQGYVSRGVCTVENHYVKNVVERTKIERIKNKVCFTDENNNQVEINEDSIVSMNCWGFTPVYFEHADNLFKEFLKNNINNSKSEFYIPLIINNLIEKNEIQCKVLPTSAEWFGVTYAGDKPIVKEKLKHLAEKGKYPSPLW
ncbi:MAG: nucleotidyltransferase [Bacteroidetes bacterium]|nr:nucleotidyltransferase [Bacteroidota bacterium]